MRAISLCALLGTSLTIVSGALAQEAAPATQATEVAKVDIVEQVRVLATADFTAMREAAALLATTGDPRMVPILQALLDEIGRAHV